MSSLDAILSSNLLPSPKQENSETKAMKSKLSEIFLDSRPPSDRYADEGHELSFRLCQRLRELDTTFRQDAEDTLSSLKHIRESLDATTTSQQCMADTINGTRMGPIHGYLEKLQKEEQEEDALKAKQKESESYQRLYI